MFPFPQLLFCYISKEEDTYFHVIILPSLTCDAEGGIVINLIYILELFWGFISTSIQASASYRRKKKKEKKLTISMTGKAGFISE